MSAEEGAAWIWAGISSIIAALSSAVAFMFKLNETKNAQAIASVKLDLQKVESRCDMLEVQNSECIKDRDQIRVQLAKVETELQFVKKQAIG